MRALLAAVLLVAGSGCAGRLAGHEPPDRYAWRDAKADHDAGVGLVVAGVVLGVASFPAVPISAKLACPGPPEPHACFSQLVWMGTWGALQAASLMVGGGGAVLWARGAVKMHEVWPEYFELRWAYDPLTARVSGGVRVRF